MTSETLTSETSSIDAENNEATIDRTDEEIEESLRAKIEEAVAKAVEAGSIDPDNGVVVAVDPSTGEIRISEKTEAPAETPDPVEFPAAYQDDHDSLADDRGVRDHFSEHWGF